MANRQLEYIDPTALHGNARNPRKHSRAQIRAIADSISAFGFNAPILVDRECQVIAGHGRLAAAKLLGLEKVPAIRLEDLTEAQAKAYMLADNKLTDSSSWDDTALALHLKELSELRLDFQVEDTGFSTAEIDIHLQTLEEGEIDQSDAFEIATGDTVSKSGDIWALGEHRIICGDALQPDTYKLLLGPDRAAAVFADLPYNLKIGGMVSGLGKVQHSEFAMASGEMTPLEFEQFLATIFGLLAEHSQVGSVMYACMDFRHMQELLRAKDQAKLELLNLCVWAKTNAGMGSFYRSQHELVFVLRNGADRHRNNVQLGRYGRNRTNVWTYPGGNAFAGKRNKRGLEFHPTVKPLALVADAILDCSTRGDLILDNFLGSGTTVLAAQRTGRRAAGIEIDPKYVDTSIIRWQRMTGREAQHVTGGSFQFIKAQRAQS